MKCTTCKREFALEMAAPKFVVGADETLEISVKCPRCDAVYSAWISPMDWWDAKERVFRNEK